MPGSALPNIQLTAGWNATENTWGGPMNQNLRLLDAILNGSVLDQTLTAPPGSPNEGDMYIPAIGASGAWAGNAGYLARWYAVGAAWEFRQPREGWEIYDVSTHRRYRFSGTLWVPVTGSTNTQAGTAYTLTLADAAANIEMTNAAANVVTVPLNATVPYPVGVSIRIAQAGAGATSIAATGGVTIKKKSTLGVSAQDGVAQLLKIATDTWRAFGDLT